MHLYSLIFTLCAESPHSMHSDENEYDDAYQTADHSYALPGKSLSSMPESNSDIISESISESIPSEDIETVISPCTASPPVNALQNGFSDFNETLKILSH